MIFLSHTFADKPVVEPVALALRDIFGEEHVFYDAWSIQPGDGIIQKMNEGLTDPKFVFYFVSKASLASKMVDLEWQNALYKATQGGCKIIPVLVDGSATPALLLQTLYINMFQHGIEAAKQQIIGIVQGTAGFQPAHEQFSNLTWRVRGNPDQELVVKVTASHLAEPNPNFMILLENEQSEANVLLLKHGAHTGGYSGTYNIEGRNANGWIVSPLGGAITPDHPLHIRVVKTGENPLRLSGVMHNDRSDHYIAIPQSAQHD